MPLPAIAASLIGAAASGVANVISNKLQQENASRTKYEDLIKYGRSVGATPTSLVQGITGTAGGSSAGFANSIPDFGSTLNGAVSSDAAQKSAEASQEEAAAARIRAETERDIGLMKLRWEPQKYFADIQKTLAEAFRNTKEAFLHGSMKKYYDELTTDVQQMRPWKIGRLAQGLANDMAMYNKIVQDTKTSKAQEGYFKAGANELNTRADLNRANTELTYSNILTEGLKSFRIKWENDLLQSGIDPNKSFWENTGRLMYTDPKLFNERMDMFINSLQKIDGKLQDNLGSHYKTNIGIGVGLYQLNKLHQQNANNRSMRFKNLTQGIGALIPFAGGSVPSVVTDTKLPWYMDDGRF